MKYLDLLNAIRNIAKVSKAKLPAVIAWLNQTLAVLEAGEPAAPSLALCERLPEEEAIEAEIAQALTAEGTQAAFDGSRLRRLAGLAKEYGPAILGLLKLFGVNVPSIPGVG